MFEYLDLRASPASRNHLDSDYRKRLVLLALSTCAYCKRAKGFLEKEGLPFRWIHLDETEAAIKERVGREFRERFGIPLTYPVLIIDEEDYLVGFIEASWKMELLS